MADRASLLWDGDAKLVTLSFAAFLVAVFAMLALGYTKAQFAIAIVFVVLICLTGGMAGLNSSRMFGGRRNFTGRLLFTLSASILLLGISMFFAALSTFTQTNEFLTTSIEGELLAVFFVLAIVVSAFGLVTAARAVASGFDRNVASRIILALAINSVLALIEFAAELRATPGLSVLGAVETDLPWVVSFFVLLAGALILIGQLGKWYATPGIRMVAYGYVFLAIIPSLVRGLVIQSGLDYLYQIVLFISSLALLLYAIGLGLNRARPISRVLDD